MKIPREHYKNPKQLPREEMISAGSPLCAGCGGLTTLRLVHNTLGSKVVVVNAAGCMTLMATYPHTPMRSSWLYTTMGSVSAGAQGVRDALDLRKAKGQLSEDEDLKVLVVAGDGSTYDMGMSATSAALHRGLDYWYLCYDNEAYGNTGFQRSASSPLGSRTSTSAPTSAHPEGAPLGKKDIFEIWRAHDPPYIATVSSHDAVDLAEKVHRSLQWRGPKLFLSLATCPTGWGFDPACGHDLGRLAVESGVWPLKEYFEGRVRHTYVPREFVPVEEYLRPQGRFRHLFEPGRGEVLRQIQRRVDTYWDRVRESEPTARVPSAADLPMAEQRS